MSVESKIQHIEIKDLRLPYRTFDSPTATDNMWQDGRNCYSNSRGYLERRPGFGATVEDVPTVFSNIQRIFTWQRWDGTTNSGHYLMLSDLDGGVAKVYSYHFGTSTSCALIWTSTSTEPFDFVESNNFCFFGNKTDMKKYDGATVWKWGIDKPTSIAVVAPINDGSASSTDTTFNLSMDARSAPWAFNDAHYPYGLQPSDQPPPLPAVVLAYTVTPGQVFTVSAVVPSGVRPKHEGTYILDGNGGTSDHPQHPFVTGSTGAKTPAYYMPGSTVGICGLVGAFVDSFGAVVLPLSIGTGAVFTAPDGAVRMQFGVNDDRYDDNQGAYTFTVVASAVAAPTITESYLWRYTYGNSTTGHESSSSALSAGVIPADTTTAYSVAVVASADPQVDQIHVYRTTFGGSTNPSKMQELPNSPYANASAVITDSASDTGLQISYCPGQYSNDPPTASQGFIWAQNRIWSFAGNTLYYSGFEEIIKGVPEECWPSGADGNFHPYKRAIYALAPMPNGVDVITALTHYGVDGDTLDTFRWSTLLERRGTKSRTLALTLGTTTLWMDTSGQLWSSAGSAGIEQAVGQYRWHSQDQGEVGLDLRPTFETMTPSLTAMTPHIAGQFHWLIVMDGANSLLYTLNLDSMQWQVPWSLPATAIHSGETADGVVDLIVAHNGNTLLKLTPDTYTDNGATYDAWIRTNLFPLAKYEQTAVVDYLQIERNAVALTDVLQMVDDATGGAPGQTQAVYTSILAHEENPPQRGNGTLIVAKQYRSGDPTETNTGASACKRASFELRWGIAATKFELYTIDVAYHPAVSR